MRNMVSRPGVSGLLLVAGSHLFGEQTRKERLERRDVLQAPWLARRDQPPPTTDDPALWYDKNVAVNAAQATALALATSGQAGNPLWFTERRKWITASVAHSILRLRETTDPACLVQSIITRNNINTEAMQYGRDHEAVAPDTYRMFRIDSGDSPRICSSGLVVNHDEPWLGASLDALLPEEGSIVEVKFPFSYRNRSFADVAREQGEFCLERFEGSWRLHLSHHYNAQLQVQLFVTRAKFCHFVVWSPSETHVQWMSLITPSFLLLLISCESFTLTMFCLLSYVEPIQPKSVVSFYFFCLVLNADRHPVQFKFWNTLRCGSLLLPSRVWLCSSFEWNLASTHHLTSFFVWKWFTEI